MYKFEDVFTSSQEYASRFSGETGQWLLSIQEEALLEVLESRSTRGGLLLDVGGGHGQLAGVARSLGKELVVSVSHPDAIRNLEKREGSQPSEKIRGVVSDLLLLPYKNESVALVSCVRLLSHCEGWQTLVAEMCRVSADLVVVDYPSLVSSNILYKVLFPLKKMLEGNTRTFKIFTHSEIDKVFIENGYKLDSRVGQFFWPMVLHRKLNSVAISRFIENLAGVIGLTALFGNPSVAVFRRELPSER